MNQRIAHALSICLKAAGIVVIIQMIFIIFRNGIQVGVNMVLNYPGIHIFFFTICVLFIVAGFVVQKKYVKIDKEVLIELLRNKSNFCADCGTPVTPEAKFCPHCGKQI